ncbi:hypothetical protein WG66_007631 [Moniliophthora roreri]|nr:hypothetical protein WG66_007631 [Moniliophthora roreri]
MEESRKRGTESQLSRVNTNHALSPQDIKEIKQIIREQEKKLCILEEEITKLQAQRDALKISSITIDHFFLPSDKFTLISLEKFSCNVYLTTTFPVATCKRHRCRLQASVEYGTKLLSARHVFGVKFTYHFLTPLFAQYLKLSFHS